MNNYIVDYLHLLETKYKFAFEEITFWGDDSITATLSYGLTNLEELYGIKAEHCEDFETYSLNICGSEFHQEETSYEVERRIREENLL